MGHKNHCSTSMLPTRVSVQGDGPNLPISFLSGNSLTPSSSSSPRCTPGSVIASHRSGLSSQSTVLTVGGFLIVGLTLVCSSAVVFSTQRHQEFKIVGSIFFAVGLSFCLLCVFLQRKNLVKLYHELDDHVKRFYYPGSCMI
ncbi:hypothetical protein TTRE_0000253701 [Trichuris trichiura]|uniref:Uncharacterized protein n=1 Tax=Trichuris trichiura TaxID=36087 RepID=A0A077Z1C8_TRITR|nr:hypothetical protein TTRE_0000253701 [Trichuris trichiura]